MFLFNFKKSKASHNSLLAKTGSQELLGKHTRTNSATRYAQSAPKPLLAKSQSVEEIRKKAQVSQVLEIVAINLFGSKFLMVFTSCWFHNYLFTK